VICQLRHLAASFVFEDQFNHVLYIVVLLQNGADINIRNIDGKLPADLATDQITRSVLTGDYRKSEILEAAKCGNEEKLLQLCTPLNINAHANDGRRSTCLHLASGYNRCNIVRILLSKGADVLARDKGYIFIL
jgi:tankyrase